MYLFKLRVYIILFFLFCTLFLVFSFLAAAGNFTSIDHYLEKTMVVSANSLWYWGSWFLAYLYLPLVIFLLGLFIYFIYKNHLFEAKILLFNASGLLASELIFKPFFQISCPASRLGQLNSLREVFNLPFLHYYALETPCYPSGHTTSYVVLFGYLSLLAFLYIKNNFWKRLVVALSVLVIVLIGPSRVYLHLHWLSDIIGGYLLGFSVLTGFIILRYKHVIK